MHHALSATARGPRRWAATLILAVTAALTFTALGSVAPSASAAPAPAPRPANNYGAIALSTDGAVKSTSTKNAYRNAMRQCRNRSNYPRTCTRMVWVRNGCAAVAFTFNRSGFVNRVNPVSKKRTLGAAKAAARRKFGGRVAAICTRRNY